MLMDGNDKFPTSIPVDYSDISSQPVASIQSYGSTGPAEGIAESVSSVVQEV